MNRYLRWRDEGYLSSNGRCFDIGGTVSGALHRFETSGGPYAGSTDAYSAGDGSLMRLAPIPIAYAQDPARAIGCAAEMSRTTHGAGAVYGVEGIPAEWRQRVAKADLFEDLADKLAEPHPPEAQEVEHSSALLAKRPRRG